MAPPQMDAASGSKNLREEKPKQHGIKGAFVGGDWVDIEDCGEQFNIKNGSCGKNCEACPRSRSRNSSAKADGSYDVVIIGAGCIGGAIARELSKKDLSVLILEAADDVTQGATKGNSGIVHAGFDDKPGTNRAKFCWKGNQMFEDMDRDLHFGYQKNGSLVIATSKDEEAHLKDLKKRGEINGVKRLRIIEREELFKLEPYVNPKATAALLSPDAGNLIPYEYTIACIENAVDNGVELRIRRTVQGIIQNEDGFTLTVNHWEPEVFLSVMNKKPLYIQFIISLVVVGGIAFKLDTVLPMLIQAIPQIAVFSLGENTNTVAYIILSLIIAISFHLFIMSAAPPSANADLNNATIKRATLPEGVGGRAITVDEMKVGGTGSSSAMNGKTVETETIRTRYIVNAAGSYSDKIAQMIGDHSFKIKPRLGDYILLNRDQGHLATHTMFPCPGPMGKGVLVQTTLWGNLILGPTARDMHNPEHANQSYEEIQQFILGKCSNLIPAFESEKAFHGFAGVRAKSDRGDWIIEAAATNDRFIHAAGIDSPGLAGSPAIAVEVVRLLHEGGLEMPVNRNFNPKRAPIIKPKNGLKGLVMGPVGKETNSEKNIICKCERVTEAEVVEALHRNLPIDSTQAIRKRTRAGMGHCQGDVDNYNCECRVAAIIARENKIPVEAVGRRPWPATTNLPQRWLTVEERENLKKMQN
jgi:L-2-hydroxyglutarate oxidase LhgO